jgi:hypothetical protein
MRTKVIALLVTWQVANLVGFVSQGVIETVARNGHGT